MRAPIKIAVAVGLWSACGFAAAAAGEWYDDVAGRWTARTHSGAYCALGFAGGPNVPHGTISAVGFCPEIFLARPVWWFDGSMVVIGTRRHEVLAYLTSNWRGRLEGYTTTGEYLLLIR